MTAVLDAITLSVVQAALQQACDEMDLTFSRAAFSPVIAEANDRSDGIYSAEDGSLIAQGAGGLPVSTESSTDSAKASAFALRNAGSWASLASPPRRPAPGIASPSGHATITQSCGRTPLPTMPRSGVSTSA